jgi:hypothetical protein
MAERIKEQRSEFNRLQARVSKRMPRVAEQHAEQLEQNNAVIRDALADAEAINVAQPAAALPETAAPGVARELLHASLRQQVATRQRAAAAADQAEITPPPAVEDSTADLLAGEAELATENNPNWD